MEKYNFDELIDRRNASSYKWDVKDNELPMWVADMDFKVAPKIIDAIKRRTDIAAYGYCSVPKEYFKSYSNWWKHRHGVVIKNDELVFCTGVLAALDSIFKHFVKEGSGVVVSTPMYHAFFNCIRNNNLQIVSNKMIYKNNEYFIDFENLEKLLALDSTKVYLLCNPHNPIGKIWSKEDLKHIADLCEKYDVLLISDEIHCDIVEPGYKYNSIFTVTDKAVVLISPTKAFNLAGVQMSCIACKDKKLKEELQTAVYKDDVGEANYFSPYAAISAYNECEDWLVQMNEYVFNNKRYLVEFIKNELPNIKVIDNKATYLLWLDISYYTKNSKEFADNLRKNTGLFVSPGSQFGDGGETFLRINIATSLANVKDACSRLKKLLEKGYVDTPYRDKY